MTFEAPDERALPGPRAWHVRRAAQGPGATAALIAADDVAVERFLAGEPVVHGHGPRSRTRPWRASACRHAPDARRARGHRRGGARLGPAGADVGGGAERTDGLPRQHRSSCSPSSCRSCWRTRSATSSWPAGPASRVHEFGIGLPPRALVLHRGKETIYSLNWLPIGGFVRLEGEEGESRRPARLREPAAAARACASCSAGVVVNFALAWLIFTVIALVRRSRSGRSASTRSCPTRRPRRAGLVASRVVGQTRAHRAARRQGRPTGETRTLPHLRRLGRPHPGHRRPRVPGLRRPRRRRRRTRRAASVRYLAHRARRDGRPDGRARRWQASRTSR